MSNVTGTPDTSTRRYQEIIEKVFPAGKSVYCFRAICERPLRWSTRSRVLLDGSIALFQFDKSADEITISRECHYNLVPQTELTDEELAIYGRIAQTAAGEADT